jgi:hypothetical protein
MEELLPLAVYLREPAAAFEKHGLRLIHIKRAQLPASCPAELM